MAPKNPPLYPPLPLLATLPLQPIPRRLQLELVRQPDFPLLPEAPHLLELLQVEHLSLSKFRRGGAQAP